MNNPLTNCEMQLTFRSPSGETYTTVIPVNEAISEDVEVIEPPTLRSFNIGCDPIATCVTAFKKRNFRKKLFISLAGNLGAALAERMEDAEGWHNTSRIEPAKQSLKLGSHE